MKCRLIVLPDSSGSFIRGILTPLLPVYCDYSTPVININTLSKTVFGVLGDTELEEVFKENPPAEFTFYQPSDKKAGGLILPEGTIFIRHFGKTDPSVPVCKAIIKVLRDKGINCFTRNNDIFVYQDGKERKFMGYVIHNYPNECISFHCFISMHANYELFDRYLRLDTDKFAKKDFDSLSDIIIGLDEVGLDSTVLNEFLAQIAIELGYEYETNSYWDNEEKTVLDKLETEYITKHSAED